MWAKIDDQFADHPKVRALGVFSVALQAAAICYCSRYLTDGILSASAADQIIQGLFAPFTSKNVTYGVTLTPALISHVVTGGQLGGKNPVEIASKWDWKTAMQRAGLWEKRRRGYYVHDYLKYNPTRAKVLEEREKEAQRLRDFREKRNASSNAVRTPVRTPVVTPAPSPSLESIQTSEGVRGATTPARARSKRHTKSLLAQKGIDARPAAPTTPDFLDVANRIKAKLPRPDDDNGPGPTTPTP